MRRSFLTAAVAGLPLALGTVALGTVALGAAAPAAVAQTIPAPITPASPAHTPARHNRMLPIQAKFIAANTTHDGRLTLAQARTGKLPLIVANFQAIDTYGRGYVTFNDVLAWHMDELAARLHQRAQALRAQD